MTTAIETHPLPSSEETPPLPGMFDLILRGQSALDQLLLKDQQLPAVIQRLLGLSVLGMAVHGLAVGLAAGGLAGADATAVLWMPAAFVTAFLGALSICLPSFYFYTQLSGLDASFALITAQALRAQATTSVLILGALPFYVAIALAARLELVFSPSTVILVGALMPFVVGLLGIRAVYRGFTELATRLPRTHIRRGAFLHRLVIRWGAVYTAVAPVALFRLLETLSIDLTRML